MVFGPVPLAVAAGESLRNTSTAEGSHEGGTGNVGVWVDELGVGVGKLGDRDKNMEIEDVETIGVDGDVWANVDNAGTGSSLDVVKN